MQIENYCNVLHSMQNLTLFQYGYLKWAELQIPVSLCKCIAANQITWFSHFRSPNPQSTTETTIV